LVKKIKIKKKKKKKGAKKGPTPRYRGRRTSIATKPKRRKAIGKQREVKKKEGGDNSGGLGEIKYYNIEGKGKEKQVVYQTGENAPPRGKKERPGDFKIQFLVWGGSTKETGCALIGAQKEGKLARDKDQSVGQ